MIPLNQSETKYCQVLSLSSKRKAIGTRPLDWEETSLIYLVSTLAEGSREAAVREPWSG